MKRKIRLAVPRQLLMALDTPVLEGLARRERAYVVSLLALLLLEASGLADAEGDDEDF